MTLEQRLRSMRKIMRDMFGIDRLRAGQEDTIRSVLQRHDTLATMPTGAGKSLCYQLPALHLEGTTLVVSPLIALMKDQADKLHAAGIDCTLINSTLRSRANGAQNLSFKYARWRLRWPTGRVKVSARP